MKQQDADLASRVGTIATDVAAIKTVEAANAAKITDMQARVKAIQGSLPVDSDDPAVTKAIADLDQLHTDLGGVATDLATQGGAIDSTGAAPATPPSASPVIGSISPATPAGASGSQSLAVVGSGFGAGSTVSIKTEGAEIESTVDDVAADGTSLDVTVDFGGFVGDATVTVTDPTNGASNEFAFATV